MSDPKPVLEGSDFVLWGVVPDHYSPHIARVPLALGGGTLDELREDAPFRLSVGWSQLVAVPEGCHPRGVATCGTCGRSWDSLRHPTPAMLCPFCNGDETAAAPFECFTFPDDDERQPAMSDAALANNYADAMMSSIDTAVTALQEGVEVEGVPVDEFLDEWPLEIVRQVGRQFEVVLTVGGPDARLTCDLDSDGDRMGQACLEVSWGNTRARRYSTAADTLADWYADRTAP